MYYKITKLLAFVIGVEACAVMAGWIFGIDALTRILPNGINMKFPTAVVFFLSALGLCFITRIVQTNEGASQVALPGIALLIFSIMSALLASHLSGGLTGLEGLFVGGGSANVFGAGMPSLPTTVSFILFGLAIMFSLFPGREHYHRLEFFGYPIAIVGAVAIIGYALGLPAFYYQFTAAPVPMAFNSALSFLFLGFGLIIVSRAKIVHEN